MSNSSLVNVKVPAYSGNYTVGRSGRKIEAITIHHMAGIGSAETCGAIFQQVGRNGSSHYGIGNDGRIGLYVDEANTAWTNSNWDSNCKSVTIETSNCEVGGSWKVSDKALNSLIKLVADIAKRNNLGTLVKGKNLTWHSMFANTACPGSYLLSKIDYIIAEANKINSEKPKVTTGFKVGDKVTSISNGYAASDGSGATSILVTTPTEIKRVYSGAKYPYLVGNIGWFNESSLRKSGATNSVTFKVGDRVKIKQGSPAYNGVALASFVYNNVYRIDELNGKRAVLDVTGICTAVSTDNLIKQ